MEINGKTLRDLRKKFEIEMEKKEIEIIEYWKRELENITRKRMDVNSLLLEIKKMIDRMTNRVAILKKMISEENV